MNSKHRNRCDDKAATFLGLRGSLKVGSHLKKTGAGCGRCGGTKEGKGENGGKGAMVEGMGIGDGD